MRRAIITVFAAAVLLSACDRSSAPNQAGTASSPAGAEKLSDKFVAILSKNICVSFNDDKANNNIALMSEAAYVFRTVKEGSDNFVTTPECDALVSFEADHPVVEPGESDAPTIYEFTKGFLDQIDSNPGDPNIQQTLKNVMGDQYTPPTLVQVASPSPAAGASPPAVENPPSKAPLPASSPALAAIQTPSAQATPIPGRCPEGIALSCLPKSSGPVVFADPAGANMAASANIKNGYSTSQATADATEDGATGKAARLCGIVQSNDSSPLAKHLAAIRLNNLRSTDGQASDPCMKFADHFL